MSADTQVAELQREVDHLMEEVERYRSAAEDAMQQLDWCIGYFAGSKKGDVAHALSANRSHIRRSTSGVTRSRRPRRSQTDRAGPYPGAEP